MIRSEGLDVDWLKNSYVARERDRDLVRLILLGSKHQTEQLQKLDLEVPFFGEFKGNKDVELLPPMI